MLMPGLSVDKLWGKRLLCVGTDTTLASASVTIGGIRTSSSLGNVVTIVSLRASNLLKVLTVRFEVMSLPDAASSLRRGS